MARNPKPFRLFQKWAKRKDNCQMCHGTKGGMLGNENVVNGVVMCDYCSAKNNQEKYSVRGLPCNIVPDEKLWCISGGMVTGGGGILEWCYDEADAYEVMARMNRDPQYHSLRAHPFLEEK